MEIYHHVLIIIVKFDVSLTDFVCASFGSKGVTHLKIIEINKNLESVFMNRI